jgi:hypothetical protein
LTSAPKSTDSGKPPQSFGLSFAPQSTESGRIHSSQPTGLSFGAKSTDSAPAASLEPGLAGISHADDKTPAAVSARPSLIRRGPASEKPLFDIAFHFGTGAMFRSRVDPSITFPAADPIGALSFESTFLQFFSTSSRPADSLGNDNTMEGSEERRLIDIKSSDENEKVLLEVSGVLFAYDQAEKKWSERGQGRIRLSQGEGFYRLLMRRSQIETITLNMKINGNMKPELVEVKGKSSNRIKFLGFLPSLKHDTTPKLQPLVLRFQSADDASTLLTIWKKAIERVQSGAGISSTELE